MTSLTFTKELLPTVSWVNKLKEVRSKDVTEAALPQLASTVILVIVTWDSVELNRSTSSLLDTTSDLE